MPRLVAPAHLLSAVSLGVVVAAPALWIGGALPLVVPVFAAAVAGLWLRACRRHDRPLVVPWAAVLGVGAAALALLQWLPWAPLRTLLTPGLAAQVDATLAGTGVTPWAGASVVPGETALGAAQLVALTALFVIAAQRTWRLSAAVVAVTGSLVALIGFVHEAVGAEQIYGLYVLREGSAGPNPALLTSFVNPNHQTSLLIIGLFAAAALAVDQHRRSQQATDPHEVDKHADRTFAALAAATVQLPAVVLSLSRGGIVAFVLVAPIAAWMGLRRSPGSRRARRGWARVPLAWRATAAAGVVTLTAVVASNGAWSEVMTLTDADAPGSSAELKLRLFRETLGLVQWDRPLGVGLGAFVDVFGALDTQPSHVVFAHPESIPAGVLAELGWLGGGILLGGVALWFVSAFRAAEGKPDAVARRVALLGLVALAIQNGLDFGLQLLGVAAPAVALAGGLSPASTRVGAGLARAVGAVVLLAAVALAVWALPHTYAARAEQDAAVRSGARPGLEALQMRPLDGHLIGLLARRAAAQGRWQDADRWAHRATELRPAVPDPWLILGAARGAAGDRAAADAATREGLQRLHAPLSIELADYLLAAYPSPAQLAAVAPVEGAAWARIVAAVRLRAPRHADAVAAARLAHQPRDSRALGYRHDIALRAEQSALALHHARLWRDAAPNDATANVGLSRAYKSFSPPRLTEARDALQQGLEHGRFASQRERGQVEEELLVTLVSLGDEDSLRRASALVPELLSRPATRAVQRRRERLARPLRESL